MKNCFCIILKLSKEDTCIRFFELEDVHTVADAKQSYERAIRIKTDERGCMGSLGMVTNKQWHNYINLPIVGRGAIPDPHLNQQRSAFGIRIPTIPTKSQSQSRNSGLGSILKNWDL